MSLWQFRAAVGGYVKANSVPDESGISSEEARSLAALVDEPAIWH